MNSSDLMVPRRRVVVLAAALAGVTAWVTPLSVSAEPDASERLLPTATDLPQHLAAALQKQEPLVVMATLRGCPFCKVVREHYLVPASRSGAIVVQIHFQSADALMDWSGATSTHGRVVKQLGIEVAPTVLFYGLGGQEVAERLVGASIPDFYGSYLDDRLAQARKAVRATVPGKR